MPRDDVGASDGFPPFRPLPPWITGDLQTLRTPLLEMAGRGGPRIPGRPERLRFPMPDGSGDVLLGALDRPARPVPGRPLAVLVHGLTGCEDGYYMHATGAALLARGHAVLRLNLRGAGPARPLCRGHYHAGRSEDLRAVLAAVPDDLARDGIVAAGYSLGANMLLKMLGEGGADPRLRAACAVSAPIDLAATSRRFLAPRNRVYHGWLLARMKREAAAAPGAGEEERRILSGVRTTLEFDDRVVAPANGFASADDYYARSSALRFLAGIRVPTLVVHALDDPWIPGDAYASFRWADAPSLTPLLPRGGGHVGFHDRDGRWHDRCLVRFLERRGL